MTLFVIAVPTASRCFHYSMYLLLWLCVFCTLVECTIVLNPATPLSPACSQRCSRLPVCQLQFAYVHAIYGMHMTSVYSHDYQLISWVKFVWEFRPQMPTERWLRETFNVSVSQVRWHSLQSVMKNTNTVNGTFDRHPANLLSVAVWRTKTACFRP